MKHIYYSLTISLLVGLCTISCETKEKEQPQTSTIKGQLVSHSSCKSSLKSTPEVDTSPDSLSCIEYTFNNETKTLIINHTNAAFNCCPDSLYCTVTVKGDTLLIQEFEQSSLCSCNCLYDLTIEVDSLDVKAYHMVFIEPYVRDEAQLIVDMDLTQSYHGTYCITRKFYPWGMESGN